MKSYEELEDAIQELEKTRADYFIEQVRCPVELFVQLLTLRWAQDREDLLPEGWPLMSELMKDFQEISKIEAKKVN